MVFRRLKSLSVAGIVSATFLSMFASGCDDSPELPPRDVGADTSTGSDMSTGDDTAMFEDTATGEDTASGDIGEPGPDPNCTIEPKLSSLSSNYFSGSCTACHGAGAQGGLDLRATGLHARLVGVMPANPNAKGRGKNLISANDPTTSFLLQKVDGTHARDEGLLMPLGLDEPSADDLGCSVFMLRKWIADGALDN